MLIYFHRLYYGNVATREHYYTFCNTLQNLITIEYFSQLVRVSTRQLASSAINDPQIKRSFEQRPSRFHAVCNYGA